MSNTHLTPHDKFFRSIMVNPKVAREFFEQNLPEDVKAVIDFSTIQLQKESYIGDKLRLQVADLLYSADFSGKQGYLYVLIEHQSSPSRFMALRIIKYIIAIMEEHIKKTRDRFLPAVYPCIYYTGNRKYNYSTDLFDLFGRNKELVRNVLLRPYQLIDLSEIPDEKLKERFLRYGVVAQVMKHIHDNNFLPILKEVVGDLKTIEELGEMDYIHAVLSYAMNANDLDKKEFIEVVKKGLTKISEGEIMTLADQFRQEGRQEGKREGYNEAMLAIEQEKRASLEKGKQEKAETIALNLFSQGLSFEQIATATGLTSQQIEEIKSKFKHQ